MPLLCAFASLRDKVVYLSEIACKAHNLILDTTFSVGLLPHSRLSTVKIMFNTANQFTIPRDSGS